MEINYKLEEADFLEYQLYTASKSERISTQKRNGWFFLILGPLPFVIFYYFQGDVGLSICLIVTAIVLCFAYPKYFAWLYKKHYRKFSNDTYKNLIGEDVKLKFSEEFIFYVDKTGEGKTKLKEIEVINETKYHFFIKASTGMSIIIPKRELEDENALKSEFQTLGLSIHDDVDWVWK